MAQFRAGQLKAFYEDVLDAAYMEYHCEPFTLVKVVPAYNHIPALLDVLHARGVLSNVVLKRSSAQLHPEIVTDIKTSLSDGIVIELPKTDAEVIEKLGNTDDAQTFIISDHGGYFSSSVPLLTQNFGARFLGITEHTTNGEERISKSLIASGLGVPFHSSAKGSLKEESDKHIAFNIAGKISQQVKRSAVSNTVLIGYGVMGRWCATSLYHMGHTVNVYDTDPDQMRLAQLDGMRLVENRSDILERADLVILGTNHIKTNSPILSAEDLKSMQDGVLLTSMTSIEEEVDIQDLNSWGRHINVLNSGCPLNTDEIDGGAGFEICLVEAGELWAAYKMAHGDMPPSQYPARLSQDDIAKIRAIGQRHFA